MFAVRETQKKPEIALLEILSDKLLGRILCLPGNYELFEDLSEGFFFGDSRRGNQSCS